MSSTRADDKLLGFEYRFYYFLLISAFKVYASYTFINTPFPPLNNVPKRGSSL